MKKALLALSAAALLIAGCKENKPASAEETTTVPAAGIELAVNAPVAYFNLDTLLSKYDMYIDLSGAFKVKSEKAGKELETKGRALEKAMNDFNTKINNGLLTNAEANNIAAKLESDRQSLMAFNDTKSAELAEEEQVMLNKIQYSVVEFIKEFNSDFRYGVILSTTYYSGPVMNGDPTLDLTRTLIEGLNKRYAEDVKSGKVIPASSAAPAK